MSRAIADTSVFIAQETGRDLDQLPTEIAVSVITAAGCADHDTWIAATAMRHGAAVLTLDADFSSFEEVDVLRV